MGKIGPKIAKWVENQMETASIIGVAPSSLHQMLAGKIRLPLLRFLQIAYYLKPPKEEVDEIFDLFLAKVDLPPNALRIVLGDETPEPIKKSETDTIIDAVMAANDIPDGAKIKVYNIIKNTKGRGEKGPLPSLTTKKEK